MTHGRPSGPFARGRRALAWPPRHRSRAPRRFTIHAPDRPHQGTLPRPRLLACDLDGTLLDHRGRLRPIVCEAVQAITRSGVHVVLATGRSPWSGVADIASTLGISGGHITMQGALISDVATGSIRRSRPLPPDVYLDVIAFADRMGLDPVVTLLQGNRAERLPSGLDWIADPSAETSRFGYETDLARLAGERPMRVFLPTGPERHWSVRLVAAEAFLGRAAVVWTDASGIELLALGTSKGEALAWFAACHGVPLDEVAAVGDAANDIAMLRVAGRSAAMGSAPAEVRAAADVTVGPSREDGILDAFRWFFPDLGDELGLSYVGSGLRLLS